jgi:hypothetical protein
MTESLGMAIADSVSHAPGKHPRTTRTAAVAEWLLDRNSTPWTAEDDALLRILWRDATVPTPDIARALRRSVPSVACHALAIHLGRRPPKQLRSAAERAEKQRASKAKSRERKRLAKALLPPAPPMPRKQRAIAACPWPLDRQGHAWTDAEDELLLQCWHKPDQYSKKSLAMRLHRSTHSLSQRAHQKGLGERGPRMIHQPAPTPIQEADDMLADVKPKPTYDGVVMTERLELAWHSLLSGVALDVVLASTRGLTSVEVAALRRWSAKA